MKKTIKTMALIMVLAIFTALLFGCNSDAVIEIVVTEGSLKSVYSIDEELNIEGATLNVVYKNGKVEVVPIERAMLSNDFDTAMPSEEKTLTLIYKNKATEFKYSVVSEIEIDSPFRIVLEKSKQTNTVNILAKNVGRINDGVLAISFELSLIGIEFTSISKYLGDDYKMNHLVISESIVRVVIYPNEALLPLTNDTVIATFSFSKILTDKTFNLTAQKITISNGTRDYNKMPKAFVSL